MATAAQIGYLRQRAAALGLDPNAVIAVAGGEGLGGGIGDHGTSFGPFQLHEGGALPSGIPLSQAQAWAWSPAGINYALTRMAQVARGLKGPQAISTLVSRFERPANPGAEIAGDLQRYGVAPGTTPGVAPAPAAGKSAVGSVLNSVGGSAAREAMAQALLGGIDFNSNQVHTPNLLSLAQARLLASASPVSGAQPPQGGSAPAAGGHFKVGIPVLDNTSIGGLHPTEGLPGYPAHDYFAPSGSTVVAPITGKVVKLSGHDPSLGPIEGPHGPLGWSVYIQGNDGHTYYLTHMGSRDVKLGQTVKAGSVIGTVADYAKYGTPSHIHMGVH